MTGWNECGHAVMTGLPIDRYLGSGDLQDAENCGYSPTSVLAELGVDTAYGDPLDQFRDGYITLVDGTYLSRGGTFNCVWAVTRLPGTPYSAGTLLPLMCACGVPPRHPRGISRCVDRDVPTELERGPDGKVMLRVLPKEPADG